MEYLDNKINIIIFHNFGLISLCSPLLGKFIYWNYLGIWDKIGYGETRKLYGSVLSKSIKKDLSF